MSQSFKGALRLAAGTAALLAASAAWADDAATTSSSTEASADATRLTEVVVTATRREQSILAVPAAISAISGKTLQERGIESVNDLQFAVPSFHSGTLTGGTNIAIRGVGATTGGPGVAESVDGVYQTQTAVADIAQVDLQRVEVLRGPQGTLYGRNANAGAVNFITNAPGSTFGGSLLAGFAQYHEYHLQGVLNVPLNDDVRTRLVVDYRDRQDGFVQNVLPGGESVDRGASLSGRLRVSADLGSNAKFDLGVSGLHATGPWEYVTNYSAPTAGAIATNPFLANATFISQPWRTDVNDPVTSRRDYESVHGTLTWRLPFGELKSITAYQNYGYVAQNDGDGLNLSAAPYATRKTDRAFTQELNLSGRWDRLDFVAGAFYLDEHTSNAIIYHFGLGLTGLPPGSYLDFENPTYDTTSYAVFADGVYHLTGGLKLIAGARYSRDRITATYGNTFGLTNGGTKVQLGAFCPTETDRLTFDSITGRAGAQYDFDSSHNAYFTYSSGFKAGGANIYSCQNDFRPEQIVSYELGYKGRWLSNALTFGVAAFDYRYTNFQLQQIVGLSLNVTNAAAAEVRGVEFESAWQVDRHWTVSGSVSYIHAVYTDFSNIDGLNPQLGLQNLNGRTLNNAPRAAADLSLAYRTDALSFGRLTFRVDSSYRSRIYFREFNAPIDSQSPYGLVNLTLVWDSPDDRYQARLYATNLLNQAYVAGMGDSTSIGTRYVSWGSPRQVGLELLAKF